MASCTASAVLSICALRPISSGKKSRVCATPITRRRCVLVGKVAATQQRENTVKCGDSTPSVPPDITSATRWPTSRGEHSRCGLKNWRQLVAAKSRVKSLTQPLPSVLPMTATMCAATSSPLSISACTPLRSPGPLHAIR
jgi:hypothetical protein